ncbi:MAG: hypothetical protein ABIL09_23865 [Gemmatimonadota bacterium]
MSRCKLVLWLALLLPALVLAGCGDDEAEPAGPDAGDLSAGAAFFRELSASMNQAAALLFTGGGQIQGTQGTVVVSGSRMTFDGYSPDGGTIIDGDLVINLLVQPIAVTGELSLSGAQSGVAVVAVTIDLSGPQPAYGGTVTLEGVEFDVAAIAAEAAAGS